MAMNASDVTHGFSNSYWYNLFISAILCMKRYVKHEKAAIFQKSEQILNVFRILGARERGKIRKYHGGKWTLTTNSRLHNTWRQR